ncbi:MAG: hypothetical protein ACYC3I_05270 [Gemmataceae bacterium]
MKAMMAAILMILVAANLSFLTAQESDVTPQRSSAALDTSQTGGANVDPTVNNTAVRGNVLAGPLPGPEGCCHDCHPHGCFLKKLLIWSTYCPKERICSSCQWCNSCEYKGVKPLHLFFQNPKCFEGNGASPTFANECYRNCNNCAGRDHP